MHIPTKHNFGAGPCILPQTVLNHAAEAVKRWDEAGLSTSGGSGTTCLPGRMFTRASA